jgi:site-specific recombinase XerD
MPLGVKTMRDNTLLGPWVRRFLLEHVVGERNLSRNTQQSYRDALCQIIPFAAQRVRKHVDNLTVEDMSAELVRDFLSDVEASRACSIATRNQRLAAIHTMARFIAEHGPEHIEWCTQVRYVPFKKGTHALVASAYWRS